MIKLAYEFAEEAHRGQTRKSRVNRILRTRLAVARVHINVLASQTLRTVICVAASAYKETTPFAGEIFFGTLEFS